MLKMLQTELQQYINQELPDIQAGFRKDRGTRNQIANMGYSSVVDNLTENCPNPLNHRKAREFQKNIYFFFIDYTKTFDFVDHNKLWKILKRDGNTR